MKEKRHVVQEVEPGSVAEEMGIEAGDVLVSVNGTQVTDIFDYQFLIQDVYIEVLIRKPDGEEWLLEIDKEYDEDLGIVFENGLMDEYRSCHNKCIFCFIDQMPKGMRETLYFKDDDSRLSFLQGNYVTLTNMSDEDIERIIRYRLSPINISFQTTEPELRCKMLNNRFAGQALRQVDKLYEAGIAMNGQIVLCKGVNDGEHLERSLSDLKAYAPVLESVSVVPVGLSKYRDGLYPLQPFTSEDAKEVLACIHAWQERMYREYGIHFVHASDEWYVMADEDLPEADRYDGYLQLENGVGMLRLFLDEFDEAMEIVEKEPDRYGSVSGELSVVTGRMAYPYIRGMADRITERFPQLTVHVYAVTNDFFGELITVSGLLTGRDIIAQLRGRRLGTRILLPQNVLRSGEDYFLDDVTVDEVERALQVKADIVKSSGHDFVHAVLNGT